MRSRTLSEIPTKISLEAFQSLWLDRVADGFIAGREDRFEVAYVISRHLNPTTMMAELGLRELAAEACISLTTARKHVRGIVADGHLEFTPGDGRGHKSRFRPLTGRPYLIMRGW